MWDINYESLTKFGLSVGAGLMVAALILNIAEVNVYSARVDNLEKERFEWLASNSNVTVKEMALQSLSERKTASEQKLQSINKLATQFVWWGLGLFLISFIIWVIEEIVNKTKFKPYEPKNLRELMQRIANDPEWPKWSFHGYLEKFAPGKMSEVLFEHGFFIELIKEDGKKDYTIGPAGAALVSTWETEKLSRLMFAFTIFIVVLTLIQLIVTIAKT